MILVDANLLIYAFVEEMPLHEPAHNWLDRQLNGLPKVGLPWPSLLAFVRLVSNPKIFDRPATVARAWKQVEAWLSASPSWIPLPTERHSLILGQLLTAEEKLHPNLVNDAHLAALALEHGLTLYSADRDFARFAGLTWKNPVEAQ